MATLLVSKPPLSGLISSRPRRVLPVPPRMCGNRVPYPAFRGSGYLAGSFPDGLATVEGAPAEVEVRVLWRPPGGTFAEGVVVARTLSAPDGTWSVPGLNTTLRFDVVGRKAGFNDIVVSDVTPVV